MRGHGASEKPGYGKNESEECHRAARSRRAARAKCPDRVQLLRRKPGDCWVFCSYRTVPFPAMISRVRVISSGPRPEQQSASRPSMTTAGRLRMP